MKNFIYFLFCLSLMFQTSLSFSKESINIILLPDLVSCNSHYGFELAVNKNSTLGVLGTSKCSSDRATYGASNSKVNTVFSRVFIPWRYSFNEVFKDSFFLQTMVGVENSEFKSAAGSSADVSFIDLSLHAGYQWFWESGFNVSVLGGMAYLNRSNLNKNIVQNEDGDVISFFDKNTKSNIHPAYGVVFGWAF